MPVIKSHDTSSNNGQPHTLYMLSKFLVLMLLLIGVTQKAWSMEEPTLIAPTNDLLGTTETFVWQPNSANVTKWWLYLGSRLGASDYYYSSSEIPGSVLSETVTTIPPTGSPLYVRLLYQVVGDPTWRSVDRQYTASGTPLSITDPVPGNQLQGSTNTFSWNDNGATQYLLAAGSSVGAWDYYSSGKVSSTYSVTATGLPTDGSTVYVRLWYRWGYERWLYLDETYTAGGVSGTVCPLDIAAHVEAYNSEPSGEVFLERIFDLGDPTGEFGCMITDGNGTGRILVTLTVSNFNNSRLTLRAHDGSTSSIIDRVEDLTEDELSACAMDIESYDPTGTFACEFVEPQ